MTFKDLKTNEKSLLHSIMTFSSHGKKRESPLKKFPNFGRIWGTFLGGGVLSQHSKNYCYWFARKRSYSDFSMFFLPPYGFFFAKISNVWTHTAPRLNIPFHLSPKYVFNQYRKFLMMYMTSQYVHPKGTLFTHFSTTGTIFFKVCHEGANHLLRQYHCYIQKLQI